MKQRLRREGSSYYHTTLQGFRCPSDPTESSEPLYGPGNYATNNLLLRQHSCLGSDDFPSGLSETVLFAEKYGAANYWALTRGGPGP